MYKGEVRDTARRAEIIKCAVPPESVTAHANQSAQALSDQDSAGSVLGVVYPNRLTCMWDTSWAFLVHVETNASDLGVSDLGIYPRLCNHPSAKTRVSDRSRQRSQAFFSEKSVLAVRCCCTVLAMPPSCTRCHAGRSEPLCNTTVMRTRTTATLAETVTTISAAGSSSLGRSRATLWT